MTPRSSCHEEEQFIDEQMAFVLKQAELGISVEKVCRTMGISSGTFYKSRLNYGGAVPLSYGGCDHSRERIASFSRSLPT